MMRRRLAVPLSALAVALAAGGCSSGSPVAPPAEPPTPPSTEVRAELPPRAFEVRLDGVDPCGLLTTAQRDQLGVGTGRRGVASHEGLASPSCIWDRFPEEPRDAYLVEAITQRGAEYALDSTTGVRIAEVHGLPAVETRRGEGYPSESHCLLLVDVAQGQSLWVQYDYDGVTVPMTQELACEKARNAAGMTVQTLRQQVGGEGG